MKKSSKEKKIISLEKFHRTKLIGSVCGFITALILVISNGILETDTPLWLVIPLAIMIIPFIVCFAFIISWSAGKEIENHDELSMHNLNKAHSQIFTGFSGLISVALIISFFWDKPVTVNIDGNLFFIFVMGLYAMYNAFESGLFLCNEKKMSIESEQEDE